MSRLPPLKLNLKTETPRSDDSTSQVTTARERRRISRKIDSQSQTQLNTSGTSAHVPRRTPIRKQIQQENQGYVSDETNLSPEPKKSRRKTSSSPNKQKQHHQTPTNNNKRKRAIARTLKTNPSILQGLEDDIVQMDNETEGDSSNRTLTKRGFSSTANDDLNNQQKKSQPTDKYYVELNGKFEEKNKFEFDKKEELRRQRELDLELKEKERLQLKYTILTPKIALNVHKLLSIVFLFIHGLNVGYQFWNLIIINSLNHPNITSTIMNNTSNISNTSTTMSNLFVTYKNLALPSHCLSYLFITLCLIDSMDRVDFTRMTLKYFVKCITLQNNFWSIIFYFIALLLSLVSIFIDDSIFIESTTNAYNGFIKLSDFEATWKYLLLAKSILCLISWLIITVFSRYDMTRESLEKRDYSLLDDLAGPQNQQQEQQQNKTSYVEQIKMT